MTFTIHGCRVEAGVPFFAAATLLLVLDKTGTACAGIVSAAVHEAAHILAAGLLGERIAELHLNLFGAEIIRQSHRGYRQDILISLAGPIANLALFLCFAAFRGMQSKWAEANLILCAFNLLPIEPLDGGQALLSFLCIHAQPEAAERTSGLLSFGVLLPLAAAGFYVLLRSRWNFTLLAAACYLTAYLLMKR